MQTEITTTKRILGRQIGRELEYSELEMVAGADLESLYADADGRSGTDSVPHLGTCTREMDCD